MTGNYSELCQKKKKKKKGTIGKENTRKTYNVKLNYVEFFRGLIKNDMK